MLDQYNNFYPTPDKFAFLIMIMYGYNKVKLHVNHFWELKGLIIEQTIKKGSLYLNITESTSWIIPISCLEQETKADSSSLSLSPVPCDNT